MRKRSTPRSASVLDERHVTAASAWALRLARGQDIRTNGAILIRNRKAKAVSLDKPGHDGKKVDL
jgi:hypothetical protein